MNPLDALHLQLRLEGREVVGGNLLRQVEAVPGEEMPLMILARLADERVVAYFDESLQPDIRMGLIRNLEEVHFPKIDPLLGELTRRSTSFEAGRYKTALFPEGFPAALGHGAIRYPRHHPLVQAFGFGDFAESVYAVEREARIVSACVSTRENDQCGEAWVYTDPQYRSQGLAHKVVSLWAQDMVAAGKIPFYSHKLENAASASLARRLGLLPVFDEIVVSYG